jgi:hypothetical protein
MYLLESMMYSMPHKIIVTNWFIVVMIWTYIQKMPGLKNGWDILLYIYSVPSGKWQDSTLIES